MSTLTDYEMEQVREIAFWKSERPSLLLASYRKLVGPFSKLVARIVPDGLVDEALARVESLSEVHDLAADIRKAGGVSSISELRGRSLEECDRLSAMVRVRAEHLALLEGVVPAVAGTTFPGASAAAAVIDVPFVLEATLRAVRRIGHCYGFPLDQDSDRRFVLAVLNLASSDEPAGVEEDRCGLWKVGGPPGRKVDGSDTADTIEESLADDIPIEAVPVAGDVANLVLDYAFVRRADATARRVFQERRLREDGKVESIPPAPGSPRRSSVEGIVAVASEVTYVGAYGLSFGATFTATLAALAVKSVVSDSALRGFRDGASAAAHDSKGWLDSLGRPSLPAFHGAPVPAISG